MDLSGVKLICLDMDGTLFDRSGHIPDVNIAALQKCIARGIRVALVSGRNYRFLGQFAAQIDRSVLIVSSNGARIDSSAGGTCLYEGKFSDSAASYALSAFYGLGIYFEVYTENVNYIFRQELIPEEHRRSLDMYLLNGHVLEAHVMDALPGKPIQGIYKLVAFSNNESEIACARQKLDLLKIKHCSSGSHNIESMAPGVGKGSAVEKLAELLKIDVKDTLAFGDYTNDLDMILTAGHGIAMGNGVDVLKQAAEYVAPPNTLGGVAYVLNKFVLGE